MNLARFQKRPRTSDDFAQHCLRAAFFVRELRDTYFWVIREVTKLLDVPGSFDWSEPALLGIDAETWEHARQKKLDPVLVFAHPRVIAEQPRLLLYYRTVALLSQKKLSSLVVADVAGIESGKVEWPDRAHVQELVVALNSIISVVVKTSADILASNLSGWQFATAGAAIQSSFENLVVK